MKATVLFVLTGFALWGSTAQARQFGKSIEQKADSYEDAFKQTNRSDEDLRKIVGDTNQPDEMRMGACQALGGSFGDQGCAGGRADSGGQQQAANGGSQQQTPEDIGDGACNGPAKAAKLACDPLSAAVGSGTSAMLEAVATSGVQAMSMLQNQGASVNEQCKSAADMAKKMGIVQGARAAACKVAQETCISRCQDYIKAVKNSTDPAALLEERKLAMKNLEACEGFEQNFINQFAQAMGLLQTFMGAKACEKASNNNLVATTVATPPPVDCNGPARSSAICLCQRNPRDPVCVGGTRNASGGGVTTGGIADGSGGSMSTAGAGGGGLDLGGDGVGAESGKNQAKGSNGIPSGGGGGGPSNPFEKSGGGRYGNADGASQQAPGLNPSVITGVTGGGNFAGYGRPAGGGGGGGGGSNFMKSLKDKFNLKDALPGRDKFGRGLAGMNGNAAADGITGANWLSIWEKVSRQYRKETPELMPASFK